VKSNLLVLFLIKLLYLDVEIDTIGYQQFTLSLHQSNSLTSVNLRNCLQRLEDDQCCALIEELLLLPKLRFLGLAGNNNNNHNNVVVYVTTLFEILFFLSLSFLENQLNCDLLESITLNANSILQSLNLSCNCFDVKMEKIFIRFIEKNSTLKSLFLNGKSIFFLLLYNICKETF
jgi:hypothetical protein